MIKWTRKKSLWPILSALGCLFVLAVVAPQAWQRYQIKQPQRAKVVTLAVPSEAVVTLAPNPPKEQPLLIPPPVTVEPALPPHEIEPVIAVTELPFSNEHILPVPPAPAEATLAKPEFDFDALLQIRDTLMDLVDRLPTPTLPEIKLPKAKPQIQVRVTSETDRLAMLNRLDRPDSNWNEQHWSAPADERDNIALDGKIVGELLEAVQQTLQQPQEVPQIALKEAAPAPIPVPLPPITESPPEPVQEPTPPREPLLRFRPIKLFEQLDSLSGQPLTSEWSEQVLSEISRLTDDHTTPLSEALPILDKLEALTESGSSEANLASISDNQHQWLQAIQSLQRRLAIWHALLDPIVETKNSIVTTGSAPDLLTALSLVMKLLEGESHGENWREYLLLDQIADATSEGVGIDQQGRNQLAQTVLARTTSPQLTVEQKSFLASKPLKNLQLALQPWAATAVNLDRLAALVERYESGRELRFAVAIAQMQDQLRWSNAPQLQALAEHLDLYYRGSNMRLAITDDLMNQMMPQKKPIVSSVHEQIAGAKVKGQARTTTQLRVQLIPDPVAWKFGLEASGKVYSKTRSETWPARVRNAAKMQYQARKIISITPQGLNVSPTKAQAQGRHELLGVDSQLDPIPILGTLLRDIARHKNHKSRPKAMSQVKQKVVRQAQQRMDAEADIKFKNLERKFHESVLGPLEKLALIAEPRSMFTTEDRAVMQLRLANTGQLAAHTPRPLAPADSFASMQMHETALNNALAGLQLDGQRMKVSELYAFFAKKFGVLNSQPPTDLSQRAIIQFAKRDAVLINCDDDRVELILNIREVALGRDKIRNFQVHAYFRPVLHGLDVRLVRDGSLQFAGRRLKTGPRVVLHSVFGKLLEKGNEIGLMASKLEDDSRLKGLMVTQLIIDDGWIGLALGPAHPQRTAWRTSCPNAATMMR